MDLDVEPPSHEPAPRSDDGSTEALQAALFLGDAAKPRSEAPAIRLAQRAGLAAAAHAVSGR